jgi:broad specificity phosphatase PhoE
MLRSRTLMVVAALARTTSSLSVPPIPAVAADTKRLILVRHGAVNREKSQPPIKKDGFYGGNVNVPLSDVGEAEAIAAAKLIAAEFVNDVAAIESSPMRRALFGARAIGTALANAVAPMDWKSPMDVLTFEEYREIDRGPIGKGWTDLTAEEIEARDGPNAIEKFALCTTPGAYREINGGEGFCDLRSRVLGRRDAMLAELQPGRAGVIVSHMWVTRAIVGEALGESNPMNIDIPTASISTID